MWHNPRLLNLISQLLFGLTVLACVLAALVWLSHRPLFTLRQIQIEALAPTSNPASEPALNRGSLRHVNLSSIRASAQIFNNRQLRGNFFNVNLEQVRLAFEAVPWVRRANVRRVWPNGLLVELEEHRALATWPDGRLVNTQGELFVANQAEAEDDTDLREFIGPYGSEKQVTQRYYALTQWLQPLHHAPQKLTLTEREAWQVELDNGTTLALGRATTPDLLQERVQRFVAMMPQVQSTLAQKISYADLRYPNGFAIRANGLKVKEQTGKAASYTGTQKEAGHTQ